MLHLDDPNFSISASVDSVNELDSNKLFHIHVIHKYPNPITKKGEVTTTESISWNIIRSLEDFEDNLVQLIAENPVAATQLKDFSFDKSRSTPSVKHMVGSVINTIKRTDKRFSNEGYSLHQLEQYLEIITNLRPVTNSVQIFLTENNDYSNDFDDLLNLNNGDDEDDHPPINSKKHKPLRHVKPDEVSEIISAAFIAICISLIKELLHLLINIIGLFFVPWSWKSFRDVIMLFITTRFGHLQIAIQVLIGIIIISILIVILYTIIILKHLD